MKYEIKETHKNTCTDFVQEYHYSPVMPHLTKKWLGVYREGILVGVITLGWGTQPLQTINKMFPGLTSADYYEIGKMCMRDDEPKNSETQMLSAVMKWCRDNTNIRLLYTLADGIMGKCGYVYQAFNFKYGGSFRTQVYRSDKGEKIHPLAARHLLTENAEFLGKEKMFWLTPDFMEAKGIAKYDGLMFRYILPMTKRDKKLLKTSPLNWEQPYPKDKDLVWRKMVGPKQYEICDMPEFDLTQVEYNGRNITAHKAQGATLASFL